MYYLSYSTELFMILAKKKKNINTQYFKAMLQIKEKKVNQSQISLQNIFKIT